MTRIGFDNDKYVKLQSQHIRDRIDHFGGKLFLEFGGKLFDDYHASRVLPGFQPDSKVKMLLEMKDDAEIVIVVSADDIERSKRRGDLGITYQDDTLRLIDAFRGIGLFVGSVVLTHYREQTAAEKFQKRLEALGVRVYRHYVIPNYPSDVNLIVSDDGFGKNEYIETSRRLVVVTAPGPGSGKMATCLSQLYHEQKRGVKAGYAKFETFPIWNLPLKHPVNLAYEAATADLDDVNMCGFCIVNDEACREAAKQEIIRRYYNALVSQRRGFSDSSETAKIELLMNSLGTGPDDRPVVKAALDRAEETGGPAVALELNDGTIITGKTTSLLGASSACLLNALKYLAGIPKKELLMPPEVIEPIQHLKVEHLGNHNPRMHTDELLIALTIVAVNDPRAGLAIDQLNKLSGCEAHSSVILSSTDESLFKKLGVNITFEPVYQVKKLFHK